jgi:hypothetical protein
METGTWVGRRHAAQGRLPKGAGLSPRTRRGGRGPEWEARWGAPNGSAGWGRAGGDVRGMGRFAWNLRGTRAGQVRRGLPPEGASVASEAPGVEVAHGSPAPARPVGPGPDGPGSVATGTARWTCLLDGNEQGAQRAIRGVWPRSRRPRPAAAGRAPDPALWFAGWASGPSRPLAERPVVWCSLAAFAGDRPSERPARGRCLSLAGRRRPVHSERGQYTRHVALGPGADSPCAPDVRGRSVPGRGHGPRNGASPPRRCPGRARAVVRQRARGGHFS